ncbi:MlaD family protein [Endomicrobium proavitum]|uniref:Organic solvents resistance ABC transporter periplasmic protein n=1 Tax=Endomicrobium proavitum TaxID=1408281 RepID=A0A0G3WIS5_9BACT|nr:MlaD family protein [Endomicrobium proavitum]AKL97399.1 organic solvents resistance ABC transporter periplasmic protein [Endomicrobium proavitum]
MNNSVKLGLFIVVGIAAIAISVLMLGSWTLGRTYNVYAEFSNVAGLTKKAKVKISGVDVGVMRSIELKNSKARLKLAVNKNVTLYQNAKVRIVSMGVIGTKYIEISPGDSNYPQLLAGDTIESDASGGGDLFSQLSSGSMTRDLADAVKDLKIIMRSIAQHNEKIASSIGNINDFSRDLAQITSQNKDGITQAVASMKEVADKLNIVLTKLTEGDGTMSALLNDSQMSSDLKETVASAKDTVNGLKETLGRASTLQLEWNYMGRYNASAAVFVNDAGIKIMPNNSKFYYVGVANIADAGKVSDPDKASKNKLEALLGFRFNKAEVYAGALRGKAGVGASYSFFEPVYAPYRTLQVFVNAHDFTREEHGVRVDADARVGIMKWLYAGIVAEDVSHKADFTSYIKLEIKDKDLASLFGIAGVAAVASK